MHRQPFGHLVFPALSVSCKSWRSSTSTESADGERSMSSPCSSRPVSSVTVMRSPSFSSRGNSSKAAGVSDGACAADSDGIAIVTTIAATMASRTVYPLDSR